MSDDPESKDPGEPASIENAGAIPPGSLSTRASKVDAILKAGVIPKSLSANELRELDAAIRAGGFLMPMKSFTAEQIKAVTAALEGNRERYAGLIDQAKGTATRAHALAGAEIYVPPDRQVAAVGEVRAEVTRVAGIVAGIADATTSFLEVASDAQEGLIRLEASTEATRAETERLRGALEAGQKSADKAERRLFWATLAIGILTFVIAVLTVVLVLREGAAA